MYSSTKDNFSKCDQIHGFNEEIFNAQPHFYAALIKKTKIFFTINNTFGILNFSFIQCHSFKKWQKEGKMNIRNMAKSMFK